MPQAIHISPIDNHGDYRAVNVNEYKPGFFEFDLKEWNTTDTTRIRLSLSLIHIS